MKHVESSPKNIITICLKKTVILLLVICMRGLLLGAEPCQNSSKPNSTVEDANKDKVKKNTDDDANQEKTGKAKNEESKNNDKDKNKENKEEKPLKIGNLSLSTSQQPGPLVSFGENIVDKGVVQLFLFGDYYQRHHGHFTDLIPSILWGVNDKFTIFYNVPVAPSYKDRKHRSSGFEDVFVQFEYAFYTKEKKYYVDQATIVFNTTFPTGSSHVIPPTGFGAPSCFIGTTYNHTSIDWFYFGSIGSVLTSATKRCTKIGSLFLYEFGFGRNIPSPKGWIYAWMIEFDGEFNYKNRIRGVVDPNSGGNVIFMTPSIWISSEKLSFQLGAGCPIYQNLFGHQIRYLYQVVFNIGYTF